MGRRSDRRTVVRLDTNSVDISNGPTGRWSVTGHGIPSRDELVVEEPLEIRIAGKPLAVTMRTPGDDINLAFGFLLTEGLICSAQDVRTARLCDSPNGPHTDNVVDVQLTDGQVGPGLPRCSHTTSQCGICGKASIEAVRTMSAYPLSDDKALLDPLTLAGLPERLRAGQPVFGRTGGLHAAGLFRPDGTPVRIAEDVGRHNAVDKVVGWALRAERVPLRGHVLTVSGRAGFELVQKASMSGVPVMVAVSAPSTLAVDLAEQVGMTLLGFVRDGHMNVYAGAHRLGV